MTADNDTEAYYDALTRRARPDGGVRVRLLQRREGKGVFATRDFAPGDVVFSERPLVAARFVAEQPVRQCCSHCLRPMLRRGDLGASYAHAFDLLVQRFPQPAPVACPADCAASGLCPREIYCGIACRDEAWTRYHRVLCPGKNAPATHPAIVLERLCRAVDRTNPILAARAFASVQMALERAEAATAEEALRPFMRFEGHLADGQRDAELFATVHALFAADSRMASVVTLDNFRYLNGAMLQNAQQLHPVSDLHRYLELRDAHALAQMLDVFGLKIRQLAQFRVGQYMQNLTARGTGMFPVANCTNHSCVPNVVSMSRSNDYMLDVVAVRPIAAGNELFISYIDETLPRVARQRQLLDLYKFECRCELCASGT